MLQSKVVSAIAVRMRKMFSNIGHTNGTAMPETKNNRDPLAWEMYLSHDLASIAEARKKAAIQACINAGMMFDHKEHPEPMGTSRTVYSGEHMVITLRVNSAAPRFDSAKLKGVMLRHKISSQVADSVYKECLVDGSPAHIFRAMPITGDE